MLGGIIEAGAYVAIDTGMFPNPACDGATLRLRFRKITTAEALDVGQLVKASLSAAAALGQPVPKGMEDLVGEPATEAEMVKLTQEAQRQAVLWCRGVSIDGGKTWKDMRLTLDEAEQDINSGPLWVSLFPDTLWPLVVTQCWSDYTVALMRVRRFRHCNVPDAGVAEPEDGEAAV
jgi:hypothetical protein